MTGRHSSCGSPLDAAIRLAAAEFYSDRHVECDSHIERALGVARATGQGELLLTRRPRASCRTCDASGERATDEPAPRQQPRAPSVSVHAAIEKLRGSDELLSGDRRLHPRLPTGANQIGVIAVNEDDVDTAGVTEPACTGDA